MQHISSNNLLNKEAYFQTIQREENPDVLEYIEDTVKSCCDYVTSVDMMETQIRTARFRMEADEYREFIMRIDSRRRTIHEDVISSVAVLNRIASSNGCKPIFCGKQENREEVADFCIEVVTAIFQSRK